MQVQNVEFPKHPHLFSFDQIYPPGTTQEAVYQYTGRPLVENTLKGYNSTLFAYGQTGSGKTHSMMGVDGHTKLEGIIPRVVRDIYKEILALDTDDAYEVSISMCEIYLEKVKDLLRVRDEPLRVRIDPTTNEVHIRGIEEVFCSTADEVIDQITNGNMNRATSAHRMNAASSRSHCVIILNVVCKKAGGGVRVSKVKMIDLAGSETVKKTGATAQRLEEAKSINRSLSELNGVLTALGKPGAHVCFRNSALTKLLRDSLGGNAKTSLLLAASPCVYNCNETVSTMRFGERAKKVKSNAVINEELTVEEYKRRNKRFALENEKLKTLLQLRDAQMQNCADYVEDKPISDTGCWLMLTDEKQFNIVEEHAKALDTSGMTFGDVTAKCTMYDRKTGKLIAGEEFNVDITATPKDVMLQEQKKHRSMLHRQLTVGSRLFDEDKPASQRRVDDLLDEIADLKGQLRAETSCVEEISELLNTAESEVQQRDFQLERIRMEFREAAIYKQKCEFLQAQSDCELGRLQADIEYYQIMADEFGDGLTDISSADSTVDSAMFQRLRMQETLINRLRVEANRGNALSDSLVNGILMANMPEDKRKAVQAMISKFADMKSELALLRDKGKSHQKRETSAAMKEKHTNTLKSNWEKQLTSMEHALVQTVRLYKKEKQESIEKAEDQEVVIARLREHVKRQNEARSRNFARKPRVGRKRSEGSAKSEGSAEKPTLQKMKSLETSRRRRRRKKSASPPSSTGSIERTPEPRATAMTN